MGVTDLYVISCHNASLADSRQSSQSTEHLLSLFSSCHWLRVTNVYVIPCHSVQFSNIFHPLRGSSIRQAGKYRNFNFNLADFRESRCSKYIVMWYAADLSNKRKFRIMSTNQR